MTITITPPILGRFADMAAGAPELWKKFDAPALAARETALGPHCFGCTTVAGSSCGGAMGKFPS
jgi:hypothetical protein